MLLEFSTQEGVQVYLPISQLSHWTSGRDGSGLILHTKSGCAYDVADPRPILHQIAEHYATP